MNKKYPWKHAIITGLIVGIFAIASFSIFDYLDKHFGWGINATTIRGLTGLLILVILGTGIYSGMQAVKRGNDEMITYTQAVICGVLIAFTTGVFTAIVGFIYCSYLNPGYAAYMVDESRKAMIADGRSTAEIAASVPGLQKQWGTGMQMMEAVIGQTVCGTVISLVMGLFLKTKK